MTASLYTKNLLRPMDELIRSVGESDIHEATRKLQYFDGKYYGITHAMGATYFCERRDLRVKKGLKVPETYDDMLKLVRRAHRGAAATPSRCRARSSTWASCTRRSGWPATAARGSTPKTWRPQLNSKSMLETLDYLQKLNKFQSQGWSGQKYLDTQAALATGKIAMSYLSGARAIGYIEKYAPENMRDPEHFMPMLRPHGPSGKVGISALDGENWAVFSQSKYPNEAFEFLRLFYKKEHYLQYCHSVPIHLTPIFTSMLDDPAYLANERIKKWKALARGDAGRPQGQPLPAARLHPAGGQPACRFLAELDGSSIVADMVVEVMVGGKNPKARGRSRAEARRGAARPARPQALVVVAGSRAGRVRKSALVGWLLLAPSLLLLGGLVVFPVLYNVWLSLFDKHAFMPVQAFVGLRPLPLLRERPRVLDQLLLRQRLRGRDHGAAARRRGARRAAAERGLPRAQPPARRRALPVHDPHHRRGHPVEVAAERLLRPRQPPAHERRPGAGAGGLAGPRLHHGRR